MARPFEQRENVFLSLTLAFQKSWFYFLQWKPLKNLTGRISYWPEKSYQSWNLVQIFERPLGITKKILTQNSTNKISKHSFIFPAQFLLFQKMKQFCRPFCWILMNLAAVCLIDCCLRREIDLLKAQACGQLRYKNLRNWKMPKISGKKRWCSSLL